MKRKIKHLEVSRHMPNLKSEQFNALIQSLITMWADWMKHHHISNDSLLSYKERRAAGEECERLQAVRRKLLVDIDKAFDNLIT